MAARTLKSAALLFGLVAFAGAAAANDYLDDANRLIAKGDLRAARIQLKNAVQAEPQNMEAHYRLGGVYLDLGDATAAMHEARIARDGGFDPDRAAPLLARAELAAGKYRQVLDEFPPGDGDKARQAAVLVARGEAQAALNDPDAAKKSFETAQNLAPEAVPPLLAEARLLMSRQQYPGAEALFDRALRLAPHAPQALVGKAGLLNRKGDLQGARALLDQAIEAAPALLPARIARAAVLLDLDKKEQAQSDIAAVLADRPDSAAAIYLRALLYAKQKKFAEAAADLDKISPLLSRIERGYYVLAAVKYQQHQLSQAEDAARRFVARQPDDPAGHKLLGRIELELGRPQAALEALAPIERSGAADAEALDLLGRADLQAGQPAKAMKSFEAAVKSAPNNAALHYWLGISRLKAGDPTDAIAQLTRSLELAPNAPAGAVLVLTDIAEGRYEDAGKIVDMLRKSEPDSPIPGNLAGLVALARFDLGGARAAFSAVAEKYHDFVPARLNLARVADLQGRGDEAKRLLQSVLARQPANAEALTRLVELLLRSGENGEAVAAAERAHAAAPDDPGIGAGLIDLYLRLGDNNKALAAAHSEVGGSDPRDMPLLAARARAELASGARGDAAETYRKMIAIDKGATEPRRQLAAVLLAGGDSAGARTAIDAGLAVAPENQQLVEDRIAVALKTDGLAAALIWATDYAKAHPSLATAAALDGDVYVGAAQPDKAVAAYRDVYRRAPSAALAMRLYRVLTASGKAADGAGLLRDWLAHHADDLGVAAQLGASDILLHRYDEARAMLERVVEKQPQNAVALNNLAWVYQLTGDKRALPLAERAYALAPSVGDIAGTLGWILTKSDRAGEAVGLLQRASAEQPSSPAIKYHLAVALNAAGQPQAAQKLLAALVTTAANFDDKPAAEQLLAAISKR